MAPLPPFSTRTISSRDAEFRVSSGDKKAARPARPHGAVREFLKLIVELDSSRFASSRIKAGLMLLGLLAAFGLFGYAVAAGLSHYL